MTPETLVFFADELEKLAEAEPIVRIPEGGLRPGLLMNDLTQVMTPEDAALVRKNLPFYQRSGPGLLPTAIAGASGGYSLGYLAGNELLPAARRKLSLGTAGALGSVFPLVNYLAAKTGRAEKQALNAAKTAIEKARQKEKK
jgi:hypothetical protein